MYMCVCVRVPLCVCVCAGGHRSQRHWFCLELKLQTTAHHCAWELGTNLGPLQGGRQSELLSLLSNLSTSSFLWLNNTPWHGYTLLCLRLLQMIGTSAIINNDVLIIHIQSLQRQMLSWLLHTYLGVESCGRFSNSLLNFQRPLSSCIILSSHQQYIGIPICPPSCQHLLLSVL